MHAAMVTASIATFLTVDVNEASAHHGWSEYNNQQTLNVTGEIQKVSAGNPHTTIQLKAGDKVWTAVLAPPSRMERRGLPQGSLKAGQMVKLVGYPHRSEANEMRAERIIVGDRTVELR
ncbi:MAG: hypothetical protein KME42_14375 [Tildeniella nuda ZEHNDER 1965/U140]|jgi:hypothetical protein|nr:hypothetical protein [Tildeniella nuda ZEHNDER 1965/U140]